MINYEKFDIAIEQFAEGMKVFIKRIQEAWLIIKKSIGEVFDCLDKIKNTEKARCSWVIPRDTRQKSQVILNKPRVIIRKVIR